MEQTLYKPLSTVEGTYVCIMWLFFSIAPHLIDLLCDRESFWLLSMLGFLDDDGRSHQKKYGRVLYEYFIIK